MSVRWRRCKGRSGRPWLANGRRASSSPPMSASGPPERAVGRGMGRRPADDERLRSGRADRERMKPTGPVAGGCDGEREAPRRWRLTVGDKPHDRLTARRSPGMVCCNPASLTSAVYLTSAKHTKIAGSSEIRKRPHTKEQSNATTQHDRPDADGRLGAWRLRGLDGVRL